MREKERQSDSEQWEKFSRWVSLVQYVWYTNRISLTLSLEINTRVAEMDLRNWNYPRV